MGTFVKLSKKTFTYNNGKIKIFGSEKDHIFKAIKKRDTWYEDNLLEEIKKITKNRQGIFIDAGANIGNHSIFFAKECTPTKVISFEPDKKICEILRKNIIENNFQEKIIVKEIGLYSKKCFLKKIVDRPENLGATEFVECKEKTEALAIPLDSLNINEAVSCFKLDIQNLEMQALIGSEKMIKRWHPIIVAEAMIESQFLEINSFLKKLKYKIHPKSNDKKWWASSPTYIWI